MPKGIPAPHLIGTIFNVDVTNDYRKNMKKNTLEKTDMCISVDKNTKCPHGDRCCFAHNIDELVIKNCYFGSRCKHVSFFDNKLHNVRGFPVCMDFHNGGEDIIEYVARSMDGNTNPKQKRRFDFILQKAMKPPCKPKTVEKVFEDDFPEFTENKTHMPYFTAVTKNNSMEIEKVKGDAPMEIEKVKGDAPMEIEKVNGDAPMEIEKEEKGDAPMEIEKEEKGDAPMEIEKEEKGDAPMEIEETSSTIICLNVPSEMFFKTLDYVLALDQSVPRRINIDVSDTK
jgi:hypothetical protein